jgi:hypothetical protein
MVYPAVLAEPFDAALDVVGQIRSGLDSCFLGGNSGLWVARADDCRLKRCFAVDAVCDEPVSA